jgi:glyoxylase-like metal-dependent hydrolase (beta-lactamase superfamily II)
MEGSVDDLKIISVGTIYRDHGEWSTITDYERDFRWFREVLTQIGIRTSSTVTYVKSDGQNILIDVGYDHPMNENPKAFRKKTRIIHNLRYYGLEHEDIDEIFITHWHEDHSGNIPFFPKVRILYAGVTPSYVKKRLERYNVDNEFSRLDENTDWHTGMELIQTPGHATGSDYSVAIRFQKRIFVVAGDIIVSRSFYHNRTFWPNEKLEKNCAQLQASYDRIIEFADVIIPGHDVPFNNYLKLIH